MRILGISCYYHDSAAVLLEDGKIIAAAEEERFTRKKHDNSFPEEAIRYCLKEAGIPENRMKHDIHKIAFYEKPISKFERFLETSIDTWPSSLPRFVKAMPKIMTERLRIPKILKKKFGYDGDIMYIDHHLSHAAASYLASPFEDAAIVTLDGVGEWTTTAWGEAKDSNIQLRKRISFPHSLGLLYTAITVFLGFKANNDEYKIMGLAPYGLPIYKERLKQVIDVKDDGSFRLNMKFFNFHKNDEMLSEKFYKEFGRPRMNNEEVKEFHKNLAASLQALLEDIVMKMLCHIHSKTGNDNLCLGGGVGLNSVLNGKILSNTPFKRIFMNPASGDDGGAMGAALYTYNSILGKKRNYVIDKATLGPRYAVEDIRFFLNTKEADYYVCRSKDELLEKTARLIKDDKVIGWFQGRMEFGPRALGNRSILANPKNPGMQDILNEKVKHREMFRPFAPSVCEDDAKDYFEIDKPLPKPADFMLMVYPVQEEKKKEIPAVVHVDGSARLQTVSRDANDIYYDLIKEFGKITGTPVIINTSFNVKGEPIVCTPEDAYNCFLGTDIDYLVIGNFIVKKKD